MATNMDEPDTTGYPSLDQLSNGLSQSVQGHPLSTPHFMFDSSCYTFRTDTACGVLTREIKRIVSEQVNRPMSRYKQRRRKKKNHKIGNLPLVSTMANVHEKGTECRVFYSGNGTTRIVGLRKGDEVRSAISDLKPCVGLKGFHMRDTFTLLPRQCIERQFSNCIDLSNHFEAVDSISAKHCGRHIRGKYRTPMFDSKVDEGRYTTFGATANRNKKGLSNRSGNLSQMPADRVLLNQLIRKIEHAAKEFLDSRSIAAMYTINEITGMKGVHLSETEHSEMWPSLAISKNCYFASHVDMDYCMSAIFVMTKDRISDENEVISYFCFRREGVSVGLRNGDIIIFNPQKEHCMSTRTDSDRDMIAMALYMKTAVVGMNDATRDISFLENFT